MKYLVLGIGNREGGDDAVGPYIIDELKKKKLHDIDVLDVGVAPENFTDVIKKKKPYIVLLIDAIDMGIEPGKIRRVRRDQIGEMHVSTHGIPLSVVMKYLETFVSNVILIGIQPERMDGMMTEGIRNAAHQVIMKLYSKDIESFVKLE
jgi:hydrogenase 3 maturation protease